MRATLLMAILLSTLLFSCGDEDVSPYDVPVAVANAFLEQYPDATQLNWEKVGNDYEAGFNIISTITTATDTTVDTTAYKVLFSPSTELLKYKYATDTTDLPTAAQTYIENNYSGYKTTVAEYIKDYTSSPDTIFYQARVSRVTQQRTLTSQLIFSEDGQVQDQEVRSYWE
ncbi:hypothetical protein ACFSKU_20805 [Pontibacter silvestris]|uniref:Beta-lactamase-inhibitor-like PepSY-like domain-containing protein n=1 Tax=Pontibacter silvestris TaxID=2305183 RepID=A0ABW4X5B2_9BACT|nr:hypothetical protein [Pontibacter silvestris]MCC9137143.1 hypothetical protein [Pontibacter silvestris]